MSYEIGLSTPTVPNRGFTLWIWSVVMVILSGLFVGGRLAIRYYNRRVGTDDWTILASLISSVLLSLTECSGKDGISSTDRVFTDGLAVHYGYGKHSRDIEPHDRIIALKWFFAAQVMYKVVITINKISFLCLYLRIFIQPVFRRICYGGIVFLVAWGLAYILVTIFQCTPIASFWDKSIVHKTCVNSKAQWLSYAVINILSDVAILTLPIHPVTTLHLPRAKKMAVVAIFGMGLFVCITSIVRTTTLAGSADNKDPTSGPIPATIWSVIEANVGIICACLPVFHQPLQFCLPWLFGSPRSNPPSGRTRSRPKTQRDRSNGSLQDPKDMSWRKLHGSGGSYSNNVSTRGYELNDIEETKTSHEILRVMDVEVSYQDDRRSDASSRPFRKGGGY
ncbi:uncharacterized protein ACLA_042220 [Aspergillus clavatus NRRL 1]|uniref:Rhodopsin domain-containing protein n=1 Tax=Aspergillus clavatus (strain ATCC 1007 / CBS 513.65 / DSM 816 / NCTC 3887 / NRRL 1 / QM 1276 / 107) TaxID=344612 RepID=A1CLH6_ASPCL|nr:uncharacterized protein ACLA_042220 [Aspergillus clavatus NRRL 1]EAW10000.1 conserved hypothetical protein [Aspergillus clavatus NRRL 1]